MGSETDISLIILTFNEAEQIRRCVESARSFCTEIFIVDSYSSDDTLKIAAELGCRCFQNKWPGNQADQFNWALDHLPIKTNWVMRLDADEYLLPELAEEIRSKLLDLNKSITGIYLKRRVFFLNKWIKYGGYYPTYLLRIWRFGSGKYEKRWMDEQVKLSNGTMVIFYNDFVDDNFHNLAWWTEKHNNYSTREAIDILNSKYKLYESIGLNPELHGSQDKKKRWFKENFYLKLPLFIRPFIYYLYRYFFKLGFLDGKAGLIFHFLQGFWYRFLVDAKIYQIESLAKKENKPIKEIIKEHYGIEI